MSNIGSAVRMSTKLKWQIRWTISKTGRQLYAWYDMVPIVGGIEQQDCPNFKIGRTKNNETNTETK